MRERNPRSIDRQPLVSVIIPAYNAEAFLEETLLSVQRQTYPNLEIIVVDDGSEDCTAAIVERFICTDPRIKLFRQPNRGVAAARNFAIRKSTGKYVAPVDADDTWFPTKIEKQVAALQRAGERAAVAYSWSVSLDEKGRIVAAGQRWDLEGKVYQALVLQNFIGNASVPLIRRSALDLVGLYDEQMRSKDAQGCEDWDLSLRCAEKYEFRVVQEYLVGYRCYSESMSYNHAAMGRSYEIVMNEVRKRHAEIPSQVYRWSESLFYLYLTHKSNVCGDLQHSLSWLWRALKQDATVLLLPWAVRCMVTRSIRLGIISALDLIGSDSNGWRRTRIPRFKDCPSIPYEDLLKTPPQLTTGIWYKIQVRRWAFATNYRSYTC